LVAFSPLWAVTALIIKLTSPGAVLYRQDRVGQDGRTFGLLKFRSMRQDAEAETGPVFAQANDERVTLFGRFLRRTSLDEIPQLLNVLRGDMSVVGPRPERPYFVEKFTSDVPRYVERHKVKSGMTGWAQVNGLRGNTSIAQRVEYDLYYIESWSLLFDLKVILRTLAQVISGKGQ
jgi:exopolysaccharide biosynthesis polyprenyl glycosylphosphotransferase